MAISLPIRNENINASFFLNACAPGDLYETKRDAQDPGAQEPPLTQFRNVSLPTFTVFAKFLGYFRPDNMCLKKGATAGGSLGGSKGGSINKGGSGGSL